MTTGPLHSLFERLFGGGSAAPEGGDHRLAAELAARLDQGRGDDHEKAAANPEPTTALLAAYLDGGLDEAAQRDIHARLVAAPAALHDAASADAFLAAIEATKQSAPADLVAAELARSMPASGTRPAPRRSFGLSWIWSGAVAAVAIAAIVTLFVWWNSNMTASTPIAVQPIPAVPTEPPPPVLAQPQAPEASPQPAAVAGKEETKPSAPAMMPAGSEEVVPGAKPHRPKPGMVPDSETMPGGTKKAF